MTLIYRVFGLTLLWLALAACDKAGEPGQMSVHFAFFDAPAADVDYWVFARVTSDAGATTLSAAAPLSWRVGAPLAFRFDKIPLGAHHFG